VLSPAVEVNAAFNVPFITLAANTPQVVPYNLITSGNAMGAAAFDVTTGIFTVPVAGFYQVDFTAAFSYPAITVTGATMTLSLIKNGIASTRAQYQLPAATTAFANNNLNASWIDSLAVGDLISVQIQSSTATSNLIGATVSNVAPFPTTLSISSIFAM
jgi:hypothetical protein